MPDFEVPPLLVPNRVVVTGGTGCIGTALLQLLTRHGVAAVTSVSRRPPIAARRVDGVHYRLVDVRDFDGIERVLRRERPDLVIHLAGQRLPGLAEQHVAETLSTNVFGTKAVLAAAGAADVSRLVTASSGKALRFFASEIYAASKKLAEYLVSQAQEKWGISCATVRFTHVVDNSVILSATAELVTGGSADPIARSRNRVLRPVSTRGGPVPRDGFARRFSRRPPWRR